MFNSKQTRLMNILGIVSDKDRYDCYVNFCEVDFELRANGLSGLDFTEHLEHKVRAALHVANHNANLALAEMA